LSSRRWQRHVPGMMPPTTTGTSRGGPGFAQRRPTFRGRDGQMARPNSTEESRPASDVLPPGTAARLEVLMIGAARQGPACRSTRPRKRPVSAGRRTANSARHRWKVTVQTGLADGWNFRRPSQLLTRAARTVATADRSNPRAHRPNGSRATPVGAGTRRTLRPKHACPLGRTVGRPARGAAGGARPT